MKIKHSEVDFDGWMGLKTIKLFIIILKQKTKLSHSVLTERRRLTSDAKGKTIGMRSCRIVLIVKNGRGLDGDWGAPFGVDQESSTLLF